MTASAAWFTTSLNGGCDHRKSDYLRKRARMRAMMCVVRSTKVFLAKSLPIRERFPAIRIGR